jgi:hypothetical protein
VLEGVDLVKGDSLLGAIFGIDPPRGKLEKGVRLDPGFLAKGL